MNFLLRILLKIKKLKENNKSEKNIYANEQLIKELIASNREISEHLSFIEKKLSMVDDIWQIKNTRFFVPNYPIDFIQMHIVNTNTFFEQDILEDLDNYIPDNAIILDIGANIGNHSMYWSIASKSKIDKIYAFEPVPDTFKILKKNIEINNLENKVEIYNFGFNDYSCNACFSTYRLQNIGDTHLKTGNGLLQLKTIDETFENYIDNLNHVDFVKIDVEDMEIQCFNGGKKFFEKYKPNIFVESQYENINEVKTILNQLGYVLIKEYPHQNWLFIYKDKTALYPVIR